MGTLFGGAFAAAADGKSSDLFSRSAAFRRAPAEPSVAQLVATEAGSQPRTKKERRQPAPEPTHSSDEDEEAPVRDLMPFLLAAALLHNMLAFLQLFRRARLSPAREIRQACSRRNDRVVPRRRFG